MSAVSPDARSRLLIASGPRAAEARLLDEVVAAAGTRAERLRSGDRSAVRTPLRVVVPSQSLRRQVAARLVARAGCSLLGVQVQTHVALALEALGRAGEPAPLGGVLAPVLARRHAAEEPALAHWLAEFDDGYGIVVAAVQDLLDAGFDAASADAFAEAIAAVHAEQELSAQAVARAQAAGRVAQRTLAVLEANGLGHRTTLLARARAALHAPAIRPESVLPTAGLWIHGFADATGLVTEWLDALVRAFDGRVIVDVPEDPAAPGRREDRYAADFCDRMRAATRGEETCAPARSVDPPARIELLRAPGAAAELRAVAARIRALLDAGHAPESIAVVAPGFETYRAEWAAQCGRLGIPFSSEGAPAGPDAGTRRIAALARLLTDGAATPVESWLDATGDRGAADPDLRTALHVLGASRIGSVALLDLAAVIRNEGALPLPVRRGGIVGARRAGGRESDIEPGGASADATRNRRRRISRRRLEDARARAASVLTALHGWPVEAAFSVHSAALRALLHERLGWDTGQAEHAPALEALDALTREVPPDFELVREEAIWLIVTALDEASQAPAGGAGAGVQLLSFTAARARTFEQIFVLGLNRGEFPRAAGDDPVLPDALRARIRRDVLSEMPVKERLREEERAVFASLCAAAPRVVLSWQPVRDDGRLRVESPFLTRLRVARAGPELPEVLAPPLFASDRNSDPVVAASPRPAHEHAILAGLAGRLRGKARDLEFVHAVALAEVRDTLRADPSVADLESVPIDVAALARFRVTVLRMLEAGEGARGDAGDGGVPALGPWFGWVGVRGPAPDAPSAARVAHSDFAIAVTRLENIARCPWQQFLRRELGLEPVPDALAELPAPTSRMCGRVVDRVLRRIVDVAVPAPRQTLTEALAAGAVFAPWPAPDVLERWVVAAADEVCVDEGIVGPGFAAALARRVRPLLAVARAMDWHDPKGPTVLGAELSAELVLPDTAGELRRVGFRADRVDLSDDGVLRITDYKAGTPISSASQNDTRQRHLLAAIRRGEKLQAVVYHVAGRALAPERSVEGRYLFLAEKLPESARSLSVAEDAHGLNAVDALYETLPKLFAVVDHGAFVPRLDTPEGRAPCSSCDVVAACLRGEHQHRAQLTAWLEAARARGPEALTPAERAAWAVLHLPSASEIAAREDRRTAEPETDA